jgi:CheY-specific phosphatase CheX
MPIAVATANVQDEIIARARAANATFIAKPVTEDGMRGFISGAALRLRSARDEFAHHRLEELEQDALTELVNIGVSRAASNLRKMVGEQVLLSVPSVEVVTRQARRS